MSLFLIVLFLVKNNGIPVTESKKIEEKKNHSEIKQNSNKKSKFENVYVVV